MKGKNVKKLDIMKGLGRMAEMLTKKIANEYRDKARLLPPNGLQDIGNRRKLRIELQLRCNLTELEALNIINGYHIEEYVILAERREKDGLKNNRRSNNASEA